MAHVSRLQLDAQTTLAQVVQFAAAQPWPAPDPAQADDLRLLLEELLSNVLRHAFCGHAAPHGVCEVQIGADAAHIALRDNGPRFNPFDPTQPAGYGLTLVRALATGWRYAADTGHNHLQVVLALPPLPDPHPYFHQDDPP